MQRSPFSVVYQNDPRPAGFGLRASDDVLLIVGIAGGGADVRRPGDPRRPGDGARAGARDETWIDVPTEARAGLICCEYQSTPMSAPAIPGDTTTAPRLSRIRSDLLIVQM